MPHVGVSTLRTEKGVVKVKRLTTCICEWNIGWFPPVCEMSSNLEFGFIEVEYISANVTFAWKYISTENKARF